MKTILKLLIQASLYIYFWGFLISVPYFNWHFAKDHGFVSWLLLGELIATGRAFVWPWYAYDSLTAEEGSDDLSASDPAMVNTWQDFQQALKSKNEATRIGNRGGAGRMNPEEASAYQSKLRVALASAQKVDAITLDRIYPGLGEHFSKEFVVSLDEEVAFFKIAGDLPISEQIKLQRRIHHRRDLWTDWLDSNQDAINQRIRRLRASIVGWPR